VGCQPTVPSTSPVLGIEPVPVLSTVGSQPTLSTAPPVLGLGPAPLFSLSFASEWAGNIAVGHSSSSLLSTINSTIPEFSSLSNEQLLSLALVVFLSSLNGKTSS